MMSNTHSYFYVANRQSASLFSSPMPTKPRKRKGISSPPSFPFYRRRWNYTYQPNIFNGNRTIWNKKTTKKISNHLTLIRNKNEGLKKLIIFYLIVLYSYREWFVYMHSYILFTWVIERKYQAFLFLSQRLKYYKINIFLHLIKLY